LNKQMLHVADDLFFDNTFTDSAHKKITLGTQQLYLIGKIFDVS